ncbi:MAG: carboxypeptidase regulatory-like domain-containing protein, partial [Chitinophagales bacterium]
DANKPDNLVQIGNYDTSPFPAENGFNGCWGAYPFFPSGIVVASDIEEGLFVLEPNYTRASYLEGTVVNSVDGTLLNSTQIEILGTVNTTYTDFVGAFKTGTSQPGMYDVRISKPGCVTTIYPSVELQSGETYVLEAMLTCTASANVQVTPDRIAFHVAPNIFSDQLNLQYSLPADVNTAELIIADVHGKPALRQAIFADNKNITLQPTLASGFYIIYLEIPGYRTPPQQIVKL